MDILSRRPAMPCHRFGLRACIIMAVLVLGQYGCTSSTGSSRIAHVTQWESGQPTQVTGVSFDRHIYGFHASADFIWLVPDVEPWLGLGSTRVLKLDPHTLEIMAAIPLSGFDSKISTLDVGEGAVWVPGSYLSHLGSLFTKPTLF